ncbi:MAG: DnaJ domain-containing protein [Fusobacteria bacterium]|nr:DnaJ domain-containing protein [Fusobacteriota bacterium]
MFSILVILFFIISGMSLFFLVTPIYNGNFWKIYFLLVISFVLLLFVKILIILLPIILVLILFKLLENVIFKKNTTWTSSNKSRFYSGFNYSNQDYRYNNYRYNDKYDRYGKNSSNSGRAGFRYTDNDEDYEILGINRNSTVEEIKKAYKKQVRVYHPDFHQDKSDDLKKEYEDKFKKINDAYNNLKNKHNF